MLAERLGAEEIGMFQTKRLEFLGGRSGQTSSMNEAKESVRDVPIA